MAAVPALAALAAILILILTCFLAPFLYIQPAHLRWRWLGNCGPCAWLVWVDCLQLWDDDVLVSAMCAPRGVLGILQAACDSACFSTCTYGEWRGAVRVHVAVGACCAWWQLLQLQLGGGDGWPLGYSSSCISVCSPSVRVVWPCQHGSLWNLGGGGLERHLGMRAAGAWCGPWTPLR
jgi:hypothetical protein